MLGALQALRDLAQDVIVREHALTDQEASDVVKACLTCARVLAPYAQAQVVTSVPTEAGSDPRKMRLEFLAHDAAARLDVPIAGPRRRPDPSATLDHYREQLADAERAAQAVEKELGAENVRRAVEFVVRTGAGLSGPYGTREEAERKAFALGLSASSVVERVKL